MDGEVEVMRNGQRGLTRMGLAKKLEGLPDHPINQGKLCTRGQAAAEITYSLLPLLDNHPPGSVQIDPILVFVFTQHGVVVLGLRLDGDNLSARKALKRDYRR
jgi:hypothetical protein